MSDETEGPFGSGGGGLDLHGLMQKAREVQERMQAAQEAGEQIRVEGNAGGGMVTCEANGHGTIIRLTIEPTLFEAGDREMLEDLVVAAVNQAQRRAKEAMGAEIGKAAGGLPLPADLTKLF